MEENNISNFEIASSPEELQQSMERESQPQTEAPVQESAPESAPAPQQETPYVDPDAAPSEPQAQTEQPQQETTEDFDDSDIEGAVLNYLSERLGREVTDFDALSAPQNTVVDERIEAIANFVAETGRAPEDWFSYQRLNPSEMDDSTAIRVNLATEHPDLTSDEINMLVNNKYKTDTDLYSDEEVQMSKLQMKIDAQEAKKSIEMMRDKYRAPEVQEQAADNVFDETWIKNMVTEVDAMTGLEFDLGNEKTFTFGLDDDYKAQLVDKNSRLDEYFDPYVREDGSWDYDMLSSHRAVVDNIDKIVSSAYRQGMSDGQRGIVDKAANVQTQTPQIGQTSNEADPVISQLKQIMGDGGRMTFKL